MRTTLKVPFRFVCLVVVGLMSLSRRTLAQSAADATQGLFYRLGARIVVEDVTVTDVKGNPVKGLPKSAFHASDDRHNQQIMSFTEYDVRSDAGSAATSKQPGTFSNRAMQGAEGTVVVLLIDPIGMELADQMDLRLQMLKYLKTLQASTQVVVFRSSSRGNPVLIQSATEDHQLLIDAVNHSVPVQTRPVYTVYDNAIAELQNMAEYLRTVPGRKALLWFAGSFPLYVQPDYGAASALDESTRGKETREAYRALEAARIAVYPIDVRGVVIASIALNPASDTAAAANDPSTTTRASGSEAQNTDSSYTYMDKLAEATGGRAFYSQNLIWKAMGSAILSAENAYELAYRPQGYVENGMWHKISITVDGPYQVHYRTGYYAAEQGVAAGEHHAERHRLSSVGEAPSKLEEEPSISMRDASQEDRAVVFSAKVMPQPAERGKSAFQITYAVPTSDLQFNLAKDGTHHARFRVAAVAYNTSGDVLGKSMDVVETHYTDTQMALATRIGAPIQQTILVPKGAEFLMLAVQDLDTGRVGTVQLTTKTARTQGATP